MGIIHFLKDHFVKIHKYNQKISGGITSSKNTYGVFTYEPKADNWGMKERTEGWLGVRLVQGS
jgi:hypothetical protein